ncbi:MAG: hypothetical protein R3F45_01350 [Gammaproteobacteria bacterium]
MNVDDLNTDVGLLFGRRWSLPQLESVSLVSLRVDEPARQLYGYSLMDSLSSQHRSRIGGTVMRCRESSASSLQKITGRAPRPRPALVTPAQAFRP